MLQFLQTAKALWIKKSAALFLFININLK